MTKRNKRLKEVDKLVNYDKSYTLTDAIELLQKCPTVKFDQSIEISLKLGVDPRKSDQYVRGTIALPHGTGKTLRVLAFAKGDKVQAALDAGAEFAGSDEFVAKVAGGWTDFDAVVATPDMMRDVGKLGKVLGPRGLMPTPKAGTVTPDVAKAVTELRGGKIEYKVDKSSMINSLVGKISFAKDKLKGNIEALIGAIAKSKPASSKGQYMRSMYLSSTMGPGIKIDINTISHSEG